MEKQITFRSTVITDFKDSDITNIDDVPIANKAAYKTLLGEANNQFVNRVRLGEEYMAHLDPWTDVILTKEWAESYANAINAVPKPLFIAGHADVAINAKARALPDGYLVGAKVINDSLYIRNALPDGSTDDRRALIEQTLNEIKVGMLSTSHGDIAKVSEEYDRETFKTTLKTTESVKAQTNALVEADQTGSEADIILTSFKNEEGEVYDMNPKSNAEMFVALKNQIDAGQLVLKEVADKLGIKMMTAKQENAMKRLNDAESKVGNITEFVDTAVAERTTSFNAMKEAAIKDKFKEDELIEIATSLFKLDSGSKEEIDKEVERVAGMQFFKNIQSKSAASINVTPGQGEEHKDTVDNTEINMEV